MRRLVRLPDIQRAPVRVGINRHGTNAHLPQRAHDAQRNLAPVGN